MLRVFFSTGLGQMHFIAHPFGFAVAAGKRIGLSGRDEPLSTLGGGGISPTNQPFNTLEMLVPHLLQACEAGTGSHTLGSVLVGCCLKQMPAILSHLSAQGLLRPQPFGEALQLKAMHIPINPVGAAHPKQPITTPFSALPVDPSHSLPYTSHTTHPPP